MPANAHAHKRLWPNASFARARQARKGFFSRQRRAGFRFDKRHRLAKFVEFVAARFAESNSHERGLH